MNFKYRREKVSFGGVKLGVSFGRKESAIVVFIKWEMGIYGKDGVKMIRNVIVIVIFVFLGLKLMGFFLLCLERKLKRELLVC